MKLDEIYEPMANDRWTKHLIDARLKEIDDHPANLVPALENLYNENYVKVKDIKELEKFKTAIIRAFLKLMKDARIMSEESVMLNIQESIDWLKKMGFTEESWPEMQTILKSTKVKHDFTLKHS